MNSTPLIDCRSITVKAGRKLLLENVSLQISHGERLVIAGPSGAGKTTLLRTIAGLEPLNAGAIHFDGVPASLAGSTPVPPHRRGIGMVLQDLGLWPTLNVRQHLLLAPPGGRSRLQHRAAAGDLINQLDLAAHARRRPGTLSGGEQQRVALGAALMGNPRALLLDEPFQALDLVLKDQLLGTIDAWASAHACAVICVTHDVEEARQLSAGRLVIVESARVVADMTWDAAVNEPAGSESPTLTAWRQRLRQGTAARE